MEQLKTALQPLLEKAPEFGMNLLYAILILVFGRILVGFVRNIAVKVMRKSKVDETLIGFSSSLGYIGLMTMVIIAAISKLGVQTTSFVAVLGAAGLAVGLALQGSLSNFAAGVLMIIFKPIKVGDFIEGAGVTGKVLEISIFTTVLATPDNKKVIVPNAKLAGDNIKNYAANGTRRVDLSVGISYNDDMQKARDLLLDMLTNDERVLQDPAPFVGVSELGDSSVNLTVRPWVKADAYWDVFFDMNQRMKEVLDENDISIPFPQQDVHIITNEPAKHLTTSAEHVAVSSSETISEKAE
jgi:small conductance mechanosensitive channel